MGKAIWRMRPSSIFELVPLFSGSKKQTKRKTCRSFFWGGPLKKRNHNVQEPGQVDSPFLFITLFKVGSPGCFVGFLEGNIPGKDGTLRVTRNTLYCLSLALSPSLSFFPSFAFPAMGNLSSGGFMLTSLNHPKTEGFLLGRKLKTSQKSTSLCSCKFRNDHSSLPGKNERSTAQN